MASQPKLDSIIEDEKIITKLKSFSLSDTSVTLEIPIEHGTLCKEIEGTTKNDRDG